MLDASSAQTRRPTRFATALRHYRAGRRMSQLDLACNSNVSARHVSFLESGRAQPSRDMVLQLAQGLVLPLAARNSLLQAAGFVPAYPASPLGSEALDPFRAILTEMMAKHAPNPALVCDRHWNLLEANLAAKTLIAGLDPLGEETNLIRLLSERPLAADLVANYPQVLHEMTGRLQLEALEAGEDPILQALLHSLDRASKAHPYRPSASPRSPVVPIVFHSPGQPLSFLSVIAHFGTSEDVTVRDLRLELFFPTDDHTQTVMAALNP
jgi:transcriptional regulator with XRE-family HTH domain